MVKSKARRAPPPTPPARRSSAIAKGRLPPPTPPAATPAANSTCASAAAAPSSGPSAPPVLARGARRRAAARARTAATRAWATSGSRGAAPAPSPTKAAKRWGLVLKGLGEALPEVDLDADADGPAPRKGGVAADRAHVPNLGRPKARRRLAVEEGVAVRGVLEHPAYAADPLAALRLHLSNTVPQPATVPPPPTHKPSKHKQGVAASSLRVSKTAPAVASKRGGKAPAAKSKASDAFKEAKRARLASKAADAAAAGKKRRAMGRIGEKRAKEL